MGNKQPETNLEKMKGNIIKKEIHKITEVKTTMNIFLCGEKFPEDFYSYITGLSQQPALNRITINYEGRDREERTVEVDNYKHPNENLDWDYYYFREEKLEENKIHQILSVIKSKYNKGEENNVLLFVSQIDNTDELNHFIEDICQNYSPYSEYVELIFMNYNKKGYFDLYIIDNDKLTDDDDYDDKVEYEKVSKCGKEKILKVLFEKCSYFNQLGDCVVFPFNEFSLKREHEDITNNIYRKTFNILVIGECGSGKSTLINKILRKKKARTGLSKYITKEIAFYFKDRVALFDTPGITWKEDESILIELIKKNIERNNLHDQIHAIFYTINAQSNRPNYEIIRNILESFPMIKLYILLTKTGTNRREVQRTLGSFRNTLEIKLGERYRCLVDCVFPLEFKSKENRLKELLRKVHEDFEEYKIDINQIRNLETVDLMIRKIQRSDFFYNVKSFDEWTKKETIISEAEDSNKVIDGIFSLI